MRCIIVGVAETDREMALLHIVEAGGFLPRVRSSLQCIDAAGERNGCQRKRFPRLSSVCVSIEVDVAVMSPV